MTEPISVALVGPVDSGKTQFASLLYLTLVDLSNKGQFEGVLNVPVTINLMELVNDLVTRGLGPDKTTISKEVLEAYLEVSYKGFLSRRKTLRVPVADLSGESYRFLMTGITRQHFYDAVALKSYVESTGISDDEFRTMTNSILDAPVLILLANLEYTENSKQVPQGILAPDSALATFLGALHEYKNHRTDLKKPKGLALVMTHYDGPLKTALQTQGLGFDRHEDGVTKEEHYAHTKLPLTNAQLDYFKSNWGTKIRYFFSGCQPVLENNKPTFEGSRQKFEVNPNTSRPNYTHEEFEQLVKWIKELLS
jgi:hypothetical protein